MGGGGGRDARAVARECHWRETNGASRAARAEAREPRTGSGAKGFKRKKGDLAARTGSSQGRENRGAGAACGGLDGCHERQRRKRTPKKGAKSLGFRVGRKESGAQRPLSQRSLRQRQRQRARKRSMSTSNQPVAGSQKRGARYRQRAVMGSIGACDREQQHRGREKAVGIGPRCAKQAPTGTRI